MIHVSLPPGIDHRRKTPSEAIIGKINKGPAAACELAWEVYMECPILETDKYPVTNAALDELVREKKIYRHECGAFMLPPSTPVERSEVPTDSKPKPAPKIPKQFAHLTVYDPNQQPTSKVDK